MPGANVSNEHKGSDQRVNRRDLLGAAALGAAAATLGAGAANAAQGDSKVSVHEKG